MECFKAAINAGADAVYIGGQKFGARAFAGNFTDEEVLEAIRIAHFWNKKVYLTVNTLLKEDEISQLVPYLKPFYEEGLDAVIIQDMGVLRLCRQHFPGLSLHISTQMTVTESGAADLLKTLGAERIVPARELTLDEIRILKEESGLEIETFIHGAMCYCYSGQCLFSSFLGGRSGNRGRCAQPCRQPYRTNLQKKGKKDEHYPLSLKDMCVLPILPRLIEAGIDSFKIEGRMKSAEYVAGVTAIYRKYIDLCCDSPRRFKIANEDISVLSQLYVRTSLEQGYYDRHNGAEMVTADKPGYAGCSDELLKKIREEIMSREPERAVSFHITLKKEMPSRLKATCVLEDAGTVEVTCESITVNAAQKRPLSRDDVKKQMQKTGGSGFYTENIAYDIDTDIFMPVSALNELRRNTLDLLAETIRAHYEREKRVCQLPEVKKAASYDQETTHNDCNALRVSALFAFQAKEALKKEYVSRIYLSADAVVSEKENVSELFALICERKQKDASFSFYLSLPAVIRSYTKNWLEKLDQIIHTYDSCVDGICAASLSGIAACKKYGWNKELALSAGTYVWNREALKEYKSIADFKSYGAPLECNRANLASLPHEQMEMMVYGRIPMMISANCIRKTEGICKVEHNETILSKNPDKRSMDTALTDRYQAQFPVLINCMHCMNTIYNSVPLSLHNYLDEIKKQKMQALLLSFTDEEPKQILALLDGFAQIKDMPDIEFTTGHYKKGAQ